MGPATAAGCVCRRPALSEMTARSTSWARCPSRVPPAGRTWSLRRAASPGACAPVAALVPGSLLSGLFPLTAFARGRVQLWGLGALPSRTAASRPDDLATTHLGCAVLSLPPSVCCFHAQGVQLATLCAPTAGGSSCLRRPPGGPRGPWWSWPPSGAVPSAAPRGWGPCWARLGAARSPSVPAGPADRRA